MPTRPSGRIETLNGQQLYFEVHGTGEPLLLLHGFSGSSQDWVPSLAQWGTKFQLILPDLRGHGPVIGNRWPQFIQTASAFLQE